MLDARRRGYSRPPAGEAVMRDTAVEDKVENVARPCPSFARCLIGAMQAFALKVFDAYILPTTIAVPILPPVDMLLVNPERS